MNLKLVARHLSSVLYCLMPTDIKVTRFCWIILLFIFLFHMNGWCLGECVIAGFPQFVQEENLWGQVTHVSHSPPDTLPVTQTQTCQGPEMKTCKTKPTECECEAQRAKSRGWEFLGKGTVSPSSPARGPGERCELFQHGLGQSSGKCGLGLFFT